MCGQLEELKEELEPLEQVCNVLHFKILFFNPWPSLRLNPKFTLKFITVIYQVDVSKVWGNRYSPPFLDIKPKIKNVLDPVCIFKIVLPRLKDNL